MNDRLDRETADRSNESGTTSAAGTYRLARLEDLDNYEIADGQPDIRGWKVEAPDGTEIGKVDGLIADPDAMEIRYMDVTAKGEMLGSDDDENVLIPISIARLDDDDEKVTVNRLPAIGLRGVPRFGRGPITVEHERELTVYYGSDIVRTPDDESQFFGHRRPGREKERYITVSKDR